MDTPAREFPMSFGRARRAVWIGFLVLLVLVCRPLVASHSTPATLLYFLPLFLLGTSQLVLVPTALTIERDALCLLRRHGWATRIL